MVVRTLDRAVEKAVKHLPDGYTVTICTEKGAGWVELLLPNGHSVDSNDRELPEQVIEAIRMAQEESGVPKSEWVKP